MYRKKVLALIYSFLDYNQISSYCRASWVRSVYTLQLSTTATMIRGAGVNSGVPIPVYHYILCDRN